MNRHLSPGPPTPELDKRNPILTEANAIGEFLDWMTQRGIILTEMRDDLTDWYPCVPCDASGVRHGKQCKTCAGEKGRELRVSPKLVPLHPDFEVLLAEYFDIDLAAVENERRATLSHLQEA